MHTSGFVVNSETPHDLPMPALWRDRVATGLLGLSALGALVAFAGAVGKALEADAATQVMATHDMLGFAVYAGLFGLLAWRPRRSPGVWELLIAQKAVMSLIALGLLSGATDAGITGVVDGILTVVLIVAYVLTRAHTGWSLVTKRVERQ